MLTPNRDPVVPLGAAILHCRPFPSVFILAVSTGLRWVLPWGVLWPGRVELKQQNHPRFSAAIVSRAAQEKVPAWAGTGSSVRIPHAELLDSLQYETINYPCSGPSRCL